jgi:hypothetical protein
MGERRSTWLTPQWLINLIGMSDLDPCGYKLNGEFVVKCARENYTLQDNQDGLSLPWFGTVYCNPPYVNMKKWLTKCREYYQETGNDVIVLMFVRSYSNYFQAEVQHCTGIVLVKGFISFLNEFGEEEWSARHPSCLIAFGEGAFERIKRVSGLKFRKEPV